MTAIASDTPPPLSRVSRVWGALGQVFKLAAGTTSGRIGIVGLAVILCVVSVGPLLAPYDITTIVSVPYGSPDGTYWLGTDYLGRDVLSRFLDGGVSLIIVSSVAPLIAMAIGGVVGTLAGFVGGRFGMVTMWVVDVVLSIPGLILVLVIIAGLGTGPVATIIALTSGLVPGAIRVVRGITLDVVSSDYVEAAVTRGESHLNIAVREILPNTRSVLAAEFGTRVGYAALIYAGISFLGLGESPPAANWGLMINENLGGVLISPMPVVVPALAIALFTVSVASVTDSIARSVGGRTQ